MSEGIMSVADMPIETLRDAARAWRRADVMAAIHRARSGWFRWLLPELNLSLHDRVDDLIDEIERLRAIEKEHEGMMNDTLMLGL